MLRWGLSIFVAGVVASALGGCGKRAAVTFAVDEPTLPALDPISSSVTSYQLATASGTVLVSVSAPSSAGDGGVTMTKLPLGTLRVFATDEDLTLTLFSGTTLAGLARLYNVAIKKNQSDLYTASVRKPLVFVGSALPFETDRRNALTAGEILDASSSSNDLAKIPAMKGAMPPALPTGTGAIAATSDGRFALCAAGMAIQRFDTGSGAVNMATTLPFAATALGVAPRDAALFAMEAHSGGGTLALFADMTPVLTGGALAAPVTDTLAVEPRKAVFSADGTRVYVLGGGVEVDPCSATTAPTANNILAFDLEGSMVANWALPDFVSDIGVAADGTLVLSQAVAGQVSTLAPTTPTGPAQPTKLFAATCPSALRLLDRQVFVVTSARDKTFSNAFDLLHGSLDGGAVTPLGFGSSMYDVSTGDMPTPDGNTSVVIALNPISVFGEELTLSPDGGTAVFSTRTHYREDNEPLTVTGLDCTANFDLVEYGRYSFDTSTGGAEYETRAVLSTTAGSETCITCEAGIELSCPPLPGDRAIGLAALFGAP